MRIEKEFLAEECGVYLDEEIYKSENYVPMKTIPSTKLIRFWCYLFGHKTTYFEHKPDGWFCERCNHTVTERQY